MKPDDFDALKNAAIRRATRVGNGVSNGARKRFELGIDGKGWLKIGKGTALGTIAAGIIGAATEMELIPVRCQGPQVIALLTAAIASLLNLARKLVVRYEIRYGIPVDVNGENEEG